MLLRMKDKTLFQCKTTKSKFDSKVFHTKFLFGKRKSTITWMLFKEWLNLREI